jgi:hypothetical protein
VFGFGKRLFSVGYFFCFFRLNGWALFSRVYLCLGAHAVVVSGVVAKSIRFGSFFFCLKGRHASTALVRVGLPFCVWLNQFHGGQRDRLDKIAAAAGLYAAEPL